MKKSFVFLFLFLICFVNCAYCANEYIREAQRAVVTIQGIGIDDTKSPAKCLGSGFFITDNGYFLTNYHVISRFMSDYATEFENTLLKTNDGQIYKFKYIDFNKDFDIALCRTVGLDGDKVSYIPIGDSKSVNVSDKCYAIGTPIDMVLQNSITEGIISSINRGEGELSLLQHSASITHGNSGGPLLNEKGQLIGINTLVIQDQQEVEHDNIGLAVKTDPIKKLLDKNKINYKDIVKEEEKKKEEEEKKEIERKEKEKEKIIAQEKEKERDEKKTFYFGIIIIVIVFIVIVCIILRQMNLKNQEMIKKNQKNNFKYNSNQNYDIIINNPRNNKKDNYDDIDIELH